MSRSPFDPTFDQLPRELPVFPLPGVLLLPRGRLPLNIFEPRYLAMVQDALGTDRMIGMIQPTDPTSRAKAPPLYETGCAGRITSFAETEDGRLLITLTGVCRFLVLRELPCARGYRRVQPAWERFAADLDGEATGGIDRERLVCGLKGYFKTQGISANWDSIDGTPDERLVTSLAMICPFEASEKQALLEAPDLGERAKLLIALIEMAILDGHEGDGGTLPRH
ncbi:LON peptidase substrate-binding domain-containing protein [Azospirillum sp. TSO22-1]|uniref:LON peptidase substrate-binding domain-containing protein n=1 Tax=Azospirillum sp. TSO22-1 TaxID=716789 RepID=UPI000D61E2FE|nr:LON peptidase substrate-binding domain-containing protein [Azospirillum sp. TSO22-1]PWC53410.1 peptidase S16 [Azospirillum sp. TSO22-1]